MAIRECDCKEFQDSGHTDECNEHYKPNILTDLARAKVAFQQRAILAAMEIQPDAVNHQSRSRESAHKKGEGNV